MVRVLQLGPSNLESKHHSAFGALPPAAYRECNLLKIQDFKQSQILVLPLLVAKCNCRVGFQRGYMQVRTFLPLQAS